MFVKKASIIDLRPGSKYALSLDGYYLGGLSIRCVVFLIHIVVPEHFRNVVSDHNVVQDCSSKDFLPFNFKICFFFFDPKYFYEMVICCIIVTTKYSNAGLYRLNALIKNLYFMV